MSREGPISIIQDYLGYGIVRGIKVIVVTRPITKKESRETFPYRPYSKHAESQFGGNKYADDGKIVESGYGAPCSMCGAATRLVHLVNEVCPDCDGRSEANGRDPHRKGSVEKCGGCDY